MKEAILSFLKSSSYIVICSSLALLANYVLHLYLGRSLGPEGYGIFSALHAVGLLFALPFTAINFTVASELIGLNKAQIRAYLKQLFLFDLILIGALLVVFLASGKWIMSFLHLNDLSFLFITLLIPLSAIFQINIFGILQGLQLFKTYGLVIFSSQFLRLISGVFLVVIGFGVDGALLSSTIGTLCSVILGGFYIKDYLALSVGRIKRFIMTRLFKKIIFYSAYTAAFAFFFYIDIPLVKHLFSPYETGLFSVAAVLGKVPIYLVGPVGLVIFSKVVEMKKRDEPYFRFFLFSLFIAFLALIFIGLGYIIFAPLVIKMLFGKAYLEAIPLVRYYGLATIVLSLASITVQYATAIEKKHFLLIHWLANLGFVISLYLFHPKLYYAIFWLGVWSFIIVLGNLVKK